VFGPALATVNRSTEAHKSERDWCLGPRLRWIPINPYFDSALPPPLNLMVFGLPSELVVVVR
jgi:hypothetical protein